MTDLVVSADAVWTGATHLRAPLAVGVTGGHITWTGPPAAAPEAARSLSVSGVLLPGLVDHHVHSAQADLGALFRRGIIAVDDLGWVPEQIWPTVAHTSDAAAAVPRVRAAGPFLTAPGGYPTQQEWAPSGIAVEAGDPDSAAAAVRSLTAHHPLTVKVALNSACGPVLDDVTLAAAVGQAHALGLPVTAHVQGPGQTERAVRAGIDVLAHTPWSERLDDRLIVELAGVTEIISTIDIHGWGEPTKERRTALDNLRRFHAAGGRVRYGTDLGNGPLPQGVNGREIEALAACGLSPWEILDALTETPIAIGSVADIVRVPADPFTTPQVLTQASPVLKAGTVCQIGDFP